MSLLDSCVTARAHGVAEGLCLPIAHETQPGHWQKQTTGCLLMLHNLRERFVNLALAGTCREPSAMNHSLPAAAASKRNVTWGWET